MGIFRLGAKTKARVSLATKVTFSDSSPARAAETYDVLSSQYYGVATTTILFYDYFLTLADEVCRDHSLAIFRRFHTETTIVEDPIFLV